MLGETISHYRITAELGAGGMGVVYEAEDLKLGRTVALKFLPADLTRDSGARKRFVNEARTASALDHHNICTIHEVDETDDGRVFIVMACYRGETLKERIARGPLPVDESLDIATQISAGLSRAHDKGIIHRDIKPGNIFLTEDGVVKLLDFGLARLAGETRVTKTGTTVGTVMYMSPEQAQGHEVDERSDVWSVGAVLYEMLTGVPAFQGEADPAIVYQIINSEPVPVTGRVPEVPLGVENLVDKCLEKDTGSRFQSANELSAAIDAERDALRLGVKTGGSAAWKRFRKNRRAVGGVSLLGLLVIAVVAITVFFQPGATIDSLAVLPIEPFAGATMEDTIFAAGVTTELTNSVAGLGKLRVISRSSTKRYFGTDKPPTQIGAELDVKALVSGTVRRDGDDVRIVAEVVNASTGEVIWSGAFAGPVSDMLKLQSDIARSVAGAIQLDLSSEVQGRLAVARTVDPEAYEAYLRGMHWLEHYDSSCVDYFQRAIAIDSTYAPPYAGLAEWYIQNGHDAMDPKRLGELALEYAERSLGMDPDLSEGHAALAHVLWEYEYDMVRAGEEFDRALELNPSNAYAMITYAYYLTCLLEMDEAADIALNASRLDPGSPWAQLYPHYVIAMAGKAEAAIAQLDKAIEMFPERRPDRPFMVANVYGLVDRPDLALAIYDTIPTERLTIDNRATIVGLCFQTGHTERARSLLDSLASLPDSTRPPPQQLGHNYALAGDSTRAAAYIEQAESTISYPAEYLWLAAVYARIGNFDRAYYWVQWMYDHRISWITRLRMQELPYTKGPLRRDPRYDEWVERLHLRV